MLNLKKIKTATVTITATFQQSSCVPHHQILCRIKTKTFTKKNLKQWKPKTHSLKPHIAKDTHIHLNPMKPLHTTQNPIQQTNKPHYPNQITQYKSIKGFSFQWQNLKLFISREGIKISLKLSESMHQSLRDILPSKLAKPPKRIGSLKSLSPLC